MPTIIRIDSRDRETASVSNTNFTVNHVPIHTAQARIKMVIIPNLFNNIRASPPSDANSTFSYELAAVPTSFIIPSGFYNITELITYIEAQQAGITLTYDDETNLITFANATGGDFEIINKADGNSLADVLGIVTTQTVATGSSITFANKPNLFNYNMLYIASNRLSNGYNLISGEQRLSIVASIPLNEPYGSVIYYEIQEQHPIEFQSPVNIEDVDIRLINHSGEVVDLPSNHHIQVLVEVGLR
jgi:hypothetical protein